MPETAHFHSFFAAFMLKGFIKSNRFMSHCFRTGCFFAFDSTNLAYFMLIRLSYILLTFECERFFGGFWGKCSLRLSQSLEKVSMSRFIAAVRVVCCVHKHR